MRLALMFARCSSFILIVALAAPLLAADALEKTAKIARGNYLVTVLRCNDCHTPMRQGANGLEPIPDMTLGGHPAGLKVTPPPKLPNGSWTYAASESRTAHASAWGIVYASNLTPDKETGIGDWDLATFVATLRTGRHKGDGRELLPPIPFDSISRLNNEDVESIYHYLMSIKKVVNQVPAPEPAKP